MKILDKYILKTFLVPFVATFLIVLFVLVMQVLWQVFENIAGKGISLPFILKFLYYTTLGIVPQALPIGVLLSSIMALGSLGENYEFAAAKSVGISLQRLVRPLIILTVILSGINFLFLNNIFPYATLKQRNLYYNIKKKKPALALVPGSFNSDLPGYQIKFDEKYGEEQNLLKKVLIYQINNYGNQKVITAERGKIISEEGSRYMTFILYNGNYYEDYSKSAKTPRKRLKMPASQATFKEYEFNIDISDVVGDGKLDEEKFKNSYNMRTLHQLKDTIPVLKSTYDDMLLSRAKTIFNIANAKELHSYNDSLKPNVKNKENILDNFDIQNKITILNTSVSKMNSAFTNVKNNSDSIKYKRKSLNFYDSEFYGRIALSFSCLILFFIGAPLGSIIRKGGFGLPMILAIAIYVIYFFGNTLGKNLAEESSVSSLLGSWIATMVMLPLGIILTRRATKDKGIFNVDAILAPIKNFFKKFTSKKDTRI
ncbi:LptF/LptG family permease [Polaribacter batillariae]|uniref:LptF/LptG family permease n=1 Tax=Polaribacter batillariae TaxID=2808900 RepID=A0ABX7SX99_9FLAO|nr:LptF/LptG family permease [Polaribacter batillariae]QTD38329.1 LptF/LptG family permease [Polaribacter batillariae]